MAFGTFGMTLLYCRFRRKNPQCYAPHPHPIETFLHIPKADLIAFYQKKIQGKCRIYLHKSYQREACT